jgi:hypothetical protein
LVAGLTNAVVVEGFDEEAPPSYQRDVLAVPAIAGLKSLQRTLRGSRPGHSNHFGRLVYW